MFNSHSNQSPFRSNSFGGGQSSSAPPTSPASHLHHQQQAGSSSFNATGFGASSSYYGQPPQHQQPPQQQQQPSQYGNNGLNSGSWGGMQQAQPGSAFNSSSSSFAMNNSTMSNHSNSPMNSQANNNNSTSTRKTYLPGYLSSNAINQNELNQTSSNMHDESRTASATGSNAWDSPLPSSSSYGGAGAELNRRSSMSGSPVSRFNSSGSGGALFGQRDSSGTPRSPSSSFQQRNLSSSNAYSRQMSSTMNDDDAPPISSLNEFVSASSTDSLYPSLTTTSPHTNNNSMSSPQQQQSSSTSASKETYRIRIFGFPSSALEPVVQHFSQFGPIISSTPSKEGGNWVDVDYEQPESALRASRKNGLVLGGVLMIGVSVLDEDRLRRGIGNASNGNGEDSSSTNTTVAVNNNNNNNTTTMNGSNGGGGTIGRPINVLGPQSAFKPSSSISTPKKSFLPFIGGGTGTPKSTSNDPHASLFEEKQKAGVLAKSGDADANKGVLGKVSDAIFGW